MHYARTDLTANVFNPYSHSALSVGYRHTVQTQRERAQPQWTFVYYFAAGSYIRKSKEALLEVADIKRRRDVKSSTLNSYTIAEWKYTDLICFGPISRKPERNAVLLICKSFEYFCTLNIVLLTSSETHQCQTKVHQLLFGLMTWPFHHAYDCRGGGGAGQEIVSVVFNFTTYTIRVACKIAFVKMIYIMFIGVCWTCHYKNSMWVLWECPE